MTSRQVPEQKRGRTGWKRPSTTSSQVSKGIGYGSGSTRSKFDLDRVVEEKLAMEEHLMWLLCAITTFLCGDSLKLCEPNANLTPPKDQPTVPIDVVEELVDSCLLDLFEYNFNNDSLFDISNRMDYHQALIELTTALAYVPEFLPNLVLPRGESSKSIAKEILPRFRATLNQYPRSVRGHSPDFVFMDFIRRVNDLSEVVCKLARRFEQNLPPEQRVKTASILTRRQIDSRPMSASMEHTVYTQILQNYQIQNNKIVDATGKPVYNFAFKKELRSVNPFAPSLKDRTKRIAKELASIHSSLPLNASNSIFVCMDESRIDVLKILISGPDDSPYANGLFEFDVFFPSNYPLSPPKFSFLTTGGNTIRFNPNLYADGKVCLSLLGTWEGRQEERWNPQTSSLLQVLVSIQSLIFVKDAYFNEPGFEKFQTTEKGREFSNRYNMHIMQATFQYAIFDQLKHPSPFFKEVTKRHFWLKRNAIIEQAEVWLREIQKPEHANTLYDTDGDSATFSETSYLSPLTQRQNVLRLVEEFKSMPNPLSEQQ
ncbi:putative ubiquitin-conjugating enzyme protein 17 [Aphelenchoides bicaudatus]|nr:putative ubiquitin-conjugating enzyme protein 17 [Aphelenchoides bicaudatus]